MEVSESSTARASQDSLYFDVDEKDVSVSAMSAVDAIAHAECFPTSHDSNTVRKPNKLLAESVEKLGHHVRYLV